jgi:hypothetical protein
LVQAAVVQLAVHLVRLPGTLIVGVRSPRMGATMLLAAALVLPFLQLASLYETVSRAVRSARPASTAPCVATPGSAADDGTDDAPVVYPRGVPLCGAEPRFEGPPLAALGTVVATEPPASQPRFVRREAQRGPPSAL